MTNPVLHDYERLHAALDDSELDAIARTGGLASGIGRLCYLDDVTLAALVREMEIAHDARVLDLGCGRGFLGRWLLANGYAVEYTAIDGSESALDAVRRSVGGARCVRCDVRDADGGPYDAIFAVESLWSIDEAFAAKLSGMLSPRGRFLTTVASLGDAHAARVSTTVAALTAAGLNVRPFPLPPDHAQTVGRLCASTALNPPRDEWARRRLVDEAYATLAALRNGGFHYDVVLATRPFPR
jgi:SAM-dependent methyltransferase